MFKLNNLKSPLGSNFAPKRKGRGIGSGNGKTAGKGHKGQLARTGAPVHPVFEGGQVPLSRRSPKIGFRSHLSKLNIEVNLSQLSKYAGKTLVIKDLIPKSWSTKPRVIVSLVGSKVNKELPKSLEAHRASAKVQALLKEKGVGLKIIKKTTRFEAPASKKKYKPRKKI
jgi:large subunit ribosomal protein L15